MVKEIDNIRDRHTINRWTIIVICFCMALGLGLAPKIAYAMNSEAWMGRIKQLLLQRSNQNI